MILTSYYGRYRGMHGVSISNSSPHDTLAFPPLYPNWRLVQKYKSGEVGWKEFKRAYIKQLKTIDVHKAHSVLEGRVLLCYEKEHSQCHRSIVAQWFRRNGYACEELQVSTEYETCAYCKEYESHESSHTCCRLTGELIDTQRAKARSCKDWR